MPNTNSPQAPFHSSRSVLLVRLNELLCIWLLSLHTDCPLCHHTASLFHAKQKETQSHQLYCEKERKEESCIRLTQKKASQTLEVRTLRLWLWDTTETSTALFFFVSLLVDLDRYRRHESFTPARAKKAKETIRFKSTHNDIYTI